MAHRGRGGVLSCSLLVLLSLAAAVTVEAQAPVIVDHRATTLSAIPTAWIQQAKATLRIAYGHTSHGSQLVTGMQGLVTWKGSLYAFNSTGSGGALQLRDSPFSGASDLGNPDRTAWASATRNYLNTHPGEVNVVIWSWCGQVSSATSGDIDTYLGLMAGLERDYPGVKFVYMTGHLDGGGAAGNLHLRNEQIRNYCRTNNKILYDFADIESFDPDGLVNYMALRANDNCDYDSDGNGSLDRNWAVAWQSSHVLGVDWYQCSAAHSQPLNGNRKAYAAWWLWARLAGWSGTPGMPSVSIQDATVPEGHSGSTGAAFTVSLSSAWPGQVSVAYATANGTATAGEDYTPSSGTLVFAPGSTSGTIGVPVLGDAVREPDETFAVNLSNPVGAAIADAQALGTIQNDDPVPQIVVEDCATTEGNAGASACVFRLALSGASSTPATVAYSTSPGTATAGADYTSPAPGTVTFPALSTEPQTVSVSAIGDTAVELDETFSLVLASPSGATLPDPQGTATIVDDDGPSLSTAELGHGVCQPAHLGPPTPAVDLFRFAQQPRASYEVLVDGTTADAGPLMVERLAGDNSTVLETAAPAGVAAGLSQSLRWRNPLPAAVLNQHVRVRTAGCAGGCAADDAYRICVYETTYRIARFNNSGGQVTVLLIQNPTSAAVVGNAYFWSAGGTLIHDQPFTLGARSLLSLNGASIPALGGRSGSITVTHDAPFGSLAGKAVSIEPSTGFSFDSAMERVP